MNIRLATHKDIQAISTMLTEFFAYNAEQQPNYYIASNEDGKYPRSVIDSNNGDIIIAETEGRLMGLLHIEEDATLPYSSVQIYKFACIVDFFVNQKYRKNGVGHLLLEEAKHWAQSRNLEYLELMVLENNEIGMNFYKKEQFVTVSRTMRLEVL